MKIRFIRFGKTPLVILAIIIGGSISAALGQPHGGVIGGGISGPVAGSTMKLPAKKTTRPTGTATKKPGAKTTAPDNSAQLEDALSLADDARQAGRDEAAERGYLLAAKLVPGDPRPYLGLGHIYYNQKKYPDAEKFYTRAAVLARGDSEPYARLAFTYSDMKRFEDAVAAARRSVAAQPDNYYGYLALGYVLSLRHEYAEAETAYRKSVSLAPQPLIVLHSELVRILGQQRRYADALTEAKKEVDIDPKSFSARFDYAIMLQKLGQLGPSAQQYLEAIKLNPKDGAPHSNVGLIYYMTEDFSSAREHWSAAVSLGSTYEPDQIGLSILDGRLTEAQARLEDYTRKSSDDEDGWLMLGDVYRALGNDSAARVTDTRAAQIAPEYVGLKRPNLKHLRPGGSDWTSSPSNSARSAREFSIQKVYMAKDDNGSPGAAALSFAPADRTIFCVVELNVAKAGTQVRFVWKTVEIEGSRDEEIKTVEYTTKPLEEKIQGNLTLPRDWPAGTYKVDIYVNGTFSKTINYKVM